MAKQNKVSLLNRLEVIILNIMSSLKVQVSDYCELDSTEGHYNILLDNGSMMTILAYDGTRTLVEQAVFYKFLNNLSGKLSVYLNKGCHQFGMVFRRDLNPTSDIYKIGEMQKATATALGLDVDYLIEEAQEIYSKYVYDETNYIVLITQPNALDESEAKLEAKRRNLQFKDIVIPGMADSQNIFYVSSYLKSEHETYVESVTSAFNDIDFAGQIKKLDVAEAIKSIKKSVSPQTTDTNWIPQIPYTTGNFRKVFARVKQNYNPSDASHLLWQPLAEQIMRSTISATDSSSHYPIGSIITENRIYSPLLVACPPSSLVSFNDLFVSLNNASTTLPDGSQRAIPFAVSFMLKGDGFSTIALKKSLAGILAVASVENSNIKGAIASLKDYKDESGVIVEMSMSAMTWAENNTYGIDEIHVRRSKLWRVIESWGGAQVTEKGGDPILGYTSCIHGLSTKHHAPKYCAPLWEALHFMPWCRQASPYPMGTIMNRSLDGKLMKIQPFSSELSTWIKLFVGRPGTGKSVAMNNDIFETCLIPGLKRLPFIFMVDVGLSSRGPVDVIKNNIKPELKHLATYRRLKNDIRFAINPLDVAVGRMHPVSDELEAMVSFLSTLITPVEASGKPEKGLSNFLSMLIEQTFVSKKEGTEKGKPNLYEPHRNQELDGFLHKLNIDASGKSYYELVNILHDKRAYRARDLCQRYAMPILTDMISVAATNPEITSRYANARTDSGESIIEMFNRNMSEAISMYPIFTEYTKFDIDTARIIALDLQDVIGKNPKQSSLFFQIARMSGKKRIAFTHDDVETFPPNFRQYYERLVREISEDPKVFAYDELHNAKRDEGLFAELLRDCRESRKWNMGLKFASQLMSDFGDIPSMATSFVIADRGTDVTRKFTKEAISLSDSEVLALEHSPSLSPEGLIYFSKTISKNGAFVSLMILTLGPRRMWSFTSDAKDRVLKESLVQMIGNERDAIEILAMSYPKGARKAMETRQESMQDADSGSDMSEEDKLNSIAIVMAKEIFDNREYYLSLKKGGRVYE